jgi:GAF domain-containing protein
MNNLEAEKQTEHFLKETPGVLKILRDPKKRKILELLSKGDLQRMEYVLENPWIDLQRIMSIAESIMNIPPEISEDELLKFFCENVTYLTNAEGATCRTYDPIKNVMVAGASYNMDVERTEEIPYQDSIAGHVIKTKTHYVVQDISNETMYKEKEKLLSLGINSMLALPIQLIDYEGRVRREILIGTLQIYFEEKNKNFFPEEIKLVNTVLSRFSYVLAQKRKLELYKKATILRESRKALLSTLKRTQSLDQVLSFLVAKIAEIINVNRCSFFSIEKNYKGDNFAMLIAGFPLDPFAHGYGVHLSFDEHPAFQEVCETGQPLLIENARNDPRMKASSMLYFTKKIKNVYFLPIKDDTNVVTNVLVLDGDESKPVEEEDIFFSNSLIQDIELCIQASLRAQERHDSLNQMIAFNALSRLYTKKLRSPNVSQEELEGLYQKLCKSMLAIEDILTDNVPFAQVEEVNLNEIITERLEVFQFPAQVIIQQHLHKGGLSIEADKKKVGRIVGNLLDNAQKKLKELEGGVLKLSTYITYNNAVIEIGNTGTIPQEIQEKMFADYSPVSGKKGKSGQGLSIIKLFTIMHNGSVDFESLPENNWTVFRIKLPLKQNVQFIQSEN